MKWTKTQEQFILDNMKLDEYNQLTNKEMLMRHLKVTNPQLTSKVQWLRLKGFMPPVIFNNSLEEYNNFYSESDTQKIIDMYYNGYTYNEICKVVNRSYGSVNVKIRRLKESGKIDVSRSVEWTKEELEELVRLCDFTRTYNVKNVAEVAKKIGRTKQAVHCRLSKLRASGVIPAYN